LEETTKRQSVRWFSEDLKAIEESVDSPIHLLSVGMKLRDLDGVSLTKRKLVRPGYAPVFTSRVGKRKFVAGTSVTSVAMRSRCALNKEPPFS
jgi:hypothetical protein